MPGFINAVAALIDELCRSGTTPAHFVSLAQKRSSKDRDLALIYENYFAALASSNATDSESAGLSALRALESSVNQVESSSRAGNGSTFLGENIFSLVVADGFDFYTPVQVRLLSALAARGVEVIATLTYEEGRAVHLWQERTMERLKNAGAEMVYFSRGHLSVIEQAAARLMVDGVPGIRDEKTDSIQIISALDRSSEVRAAAREMKRLVVEDGFAINDFSIVCRSLSQYSHHLERVFRECSIPIALDCPLALGENPMVVAVERLLSLHASSFSRRACIDCLRSPHFDLSHYGLDESVVDMLDRISLAGNITRGREQWVEAIAARSKAGNWKHRQHDDDEEQGTEGELIARYASLDVSVRNLFNDITPAQTATRAEYAHWVLGLLERLRVKQRAEKCETSSRDLVAFETLEALIAIIGSDRSALGRRDSISQKERSISWFHFFKELDGAIAADNFPRQKESELAVVAQEVHSLRPCRFRAVFVLGLVEGEFPARAIESAPYTLVERESLRSAGIDLTETPADAGADLTQFYKTMNCASERLYISHARTDVSGGELLASYLVEELSLVAPAREVRIAQSFATGAQSLSSVASLGELASVTAYEMREYFIAGESSLKSLDEQTRAANAMLDSRLQSWKATKRGARLEHGRLRGRDSKNIDGLIRAPQLIDRLKKMFGPERLWSASQINDFGTCPFRFYAKHVLRLAPAVEPFDGFGSNDLGNAYHKILESLHSQLLAKRIQITAATAQQAAAFAEQVSEEVLEKMVSTGSIRKGPMWEFDKSEIKRRVSMLLHAEAEWNGEQAARPIHFEARFGEGDKPPLVIECEDGPVKLRGVIDRIDEREDGWVVIDYKTGRTPIRHAEALDGRNLQLPIYAMAASSVLGDKAKVASAYYLHIHSRKKGSELPHKDDERFSLEAMIAHTEERIRDYVRRARGGTFPVTPNNDRCHPYCEFDVMCRIQSLGPTPVEAE
jgi:ATP-dependent helicase/DNAse subunit B